MKNLLTRHKTKILLLVALLLAAFPAGKILVAYQIGSALESAGLSNVHLYVDEIGFGGMVLKDVRIGNDKPMVIPEVTITYTPYQLLESRVDKIIIRRPVFDTHTVDGKTYITGLEPKDEPEASAAKPNNVVPGQAFHPGWFRFNSLTVEKARLHLLGYGADATIDFELSAVSKPMPQVQMKTQAFTGMYNGKAFMVADSAMKIELDEAQEQWKGEWITDDARLKDNDTSIPAFRLKATLLGKPGLVTSDIDIDSRQSPIRMKAVHTLNNRQNQLVLQYATLPWAGGIISIRGIALPVRNNQILNTMVTISDVSLDYVLGLLTSNKSKATGTVSGSLPIGINNDGSIIFYPGELRIEKPGTISIDPAAIPGDNPQLELLKTVLSNFNYTDFSMGIESGEGSTIEVMLRLAGKNPDAYNGRPVKLNVHLKGDLVNLMQQTIIPVTDPAQLLKQKEKP